jgi:hypothetical protein
VSYLGEVLAGRPLSDGLVRVQERTGLSSLARALPVELAGHVRCACRRQQLPCMILGTSSRPTLVVWRAARASKAHLAQVGAVAVAVHAPAWHRHRLPVAVGARHAAVRGLLSQRACGSVGILRGARGVRGGRGVQRVGKGSVLEMR